MDINLRRPDHNIGSHACKGVGLALLAAVALGACSSTDSVDAGADALACPRVAIVRDASRVTQFQDGPGRDLTDVVSRAAIADFTGGCDYGDDGVTVGFELALVAERGPAMQGSQGAYEYFVAVTAPDGTILNKRTFETTIDFPANVSRSGSLEELEQVIPLPADTNARDYQILLGFQLSPDQLDYNRSGREF